MLPLPYVSSHEARSLLRTGLRRLDAWTVGNFNPVLYRPRQR